MLWLRAQPVIAAYVNAAVTDFHAAEDLIQRIAQIATEQFDDYDSDRPFTPWIMGITRNQVRKYYREYARDRLVLSPETLDLVADAMDRVEPELDGMKAALNHCIKKLGGKAKQIFEMRYVREM
ncbi:MAG: sigma-70 family RNA polymerase sigma factor, partial [Rhodospirillales bacterium]|nr:sigma-70 family RNA polymerase sigma factor [Rhodospirillales bacterium]